MPYFLEFGPPVKAKNSRINALTAELTQAHADNAKLETLWENAVAARDKLSEDLTQARADRDAAREALEKTIKERNRLTGHVCQLKEGVKELKEVAREYLTAEDKEFSLEIRTDNTVTPKEKTRAHNHVVAMRDALALLVRVQKS